MTSLPVEESPSKMVVRLRIKYNYNRTTIVLNILHLSVLLKKVMHCLVAIAFFFFLGHPVVLSDIQSSELRNSLSFLYLTLLQECTVK